MAIHPLANHSSAPGPNVVALRPTRTSLRSVANGAVLQLVDVQIRLRTAYRALGMIELRLRDSRAADALHDLHLHAALLCIRDGNTEAAARRIRVAQEHDAHEDSQILEALGLLLVPMIAICWTIGAARGLCRAFEKRLTPSGTRAGGAGR